MSLKYKALVFITLLLPISSYFIWSAFTGQVYDSEIHNATVIEVVAQDDYYIVFSDEASYTGYTVPYNDSYALYIEADDIVKVDRDYFTVYNGQWKNLNDIPPTTENNGKVFVSIASVIALGIAGLIIGGKMDLLKSHPRISALVSLSIITAILYGLNSIIADMLIVFLIVTGSWFAYCIEYAVSQGKINAKEADKLRAEILARTKG